MNATDHALIWCGWLKHWVHKEREAGTSDQSPWTPRGLTHEARGLKSASPHPCPGESGRQVPGGGAARSAVRPSLFPPSRAASCASCARAPRIRHHRAGARDRPVLQVGAALRPEGKGLPREPGFRCPRPPSLLLSEAAGHSPPNLDGTWQQAPVPCGLAGPASLADPRSLPRAPPGPVPAEWMAATWARTFARARAAESTSLPGSRPRLGRSSTGCTRPLRRPHPLAGQHVWHPRSSRARGPRSVGWQGWRAWREVPLPEA